MTVLLDAAAIGARRPALGPDLAQLAASLRDELTAQPSPIWLPSEKARLSRHGGRCRRDGTLLTFDPTQPHQHSCPQCGETFTTEDDYRFWIMNYQLWLAERAVRAATLAAVTKDTRSAQLAHDILDAYVDQYLRYPNVDNVLGPTRLFFSTYLESIWLLQVTIAVDLLEGTNGPTAWGGTVRERVIVPSTDLIASYGEHDSNRQVWNNAALAASARLLAADRQFKDAVFGPSGLIHHLMGGLLSDGTWYEGENYHLFAHRGLWYGVQVADGAGLKLPPEAMARFEAGFATPFATVLPDLTFPARRDSQYGVSLRQWRIAESCEIGLARRPDDAVLRGALHRLYHDDLPPGETGRRTSTAEAERNVPPVRLTRSSLGWKALLFAMPTLPPLAPREAESVALRGQGFAVLRRGQGRVYVALDYGHPGAGHGHPDRLNLWLVDGTHRLLEDMGTGSYTERALHWYRSSLAHNAPLINGHSQRPVEGVLRGFGDEGEGGIGWISAAADLAPDVRVTRTICCTDRLLVDEVRWTSAAEVQVDLPLHVDAAIEGATDWHAEPLTGGSDLEDGFDFVADSERAATVGRVVQLAAGAVRAWIATGDAEWWRARAPGPPGRGVHPFLLQRTFGRAGMRRAVWTWVPAPLSVSFDGDTIRMQHDHGLTVVETGADAWRVHHAGQAWSLKWADVPPPASPVRAPRAPAFVIRADNDPRHAIPDLHFDLGRDAYRRSELTWDEAGAPTARVAFTATRGQLGIRVEVSKHDLWFAPRRDDNPLDNEHPDINSDGLQLHLTVGGAEYSWLLVPEDSGGVRVTQRRGRAATVEASWQRDEAGWSGVVSLPRSLLPAHGRRPFRLDVVINDMSSGRERRRGQLVLSGAPGEWVYLRGDRQDMSRALWFVISDA